MASLFGASSTQAKRSSMNRAELASSSSEGTLPVLAEDKSSFLESWDAPPVPPRALNRPKNRNSMLGSSPRRSYEGSPPEVTYFASVKAEGPLAEGPETKKLSELRRRWMNNKYVSKKGGWKRLAVIGAVITLCIVVLAIGLGVGLKKHKSSSTDGSVDSSSSSSSDTGGSSTTTSGSSTPSGSASGTVEGGIGSDNSTTNTTTFPAGSYSFSTFLDTVSTACTNNTAAWMCYPFSIYSESPSESSATFDWIISADPKTPKSYTISSTPNSLSIDFSNLPLSLLKAGQDDEHYFLQTTISKSTKPTSHLGSDNVAATCYFNSTTFQAYLYTKMEKTYLGNSTNTRDTSAYSPWPYAVKIEQVAGAGKGTPDCVGPDGQSVGDFSVQDGTQLCDCLYLNYGT